MANSNSSVSNSMIFIAMLMFVLVSTTAEHKPDAPYDYVKNCYYPLSAVDKCTIQIIEFLFNEDRFNISAKCCKAIAVTPLKCWKGMFPNHPKFPHLAKEHCRVYAHAPRPSI